jgi:putative DeoR family transcriptional regulator (stage III sporulation protein D)
MKYNKERCETVALYMLENRATVRSTAAFFGISKSTVHKDVSQVLKRINPALHMQRHMTKEIISNCNSLIRAVVLLHHLTAFGRASLRLRMISLMH